MQTELAIPRGRTALTEDQRACLMSHLTHQRNCVADREYLRVDAHRRMKALTRDNALIVLRLVRGWY